MILIKASLLFILILFISYRVGLLINKILKSHNYITILLYGFVSIIAILQIIYIPMIYLHVSFQLVLYTTIIVLLLLIILSFVKCKRRQEIKLLQETKMKIKIMKKKNILITFLVVFIILTQATVSSVLFNENADDAFYVSLIEENKTSDAIYTKDPSLGIENITFSSRYMVSGHELALSVISKIFDVESTVLTHTIIPFIMIIFSYMAYYVLARKFFNNDKSQIFLMLLSILFLFSGFSTKLRGIILLSRMWQGKEIFLNIILPLIISNLINLNKHNRKKNLVSLIILNFSSVFFTNTAIFLVPFAYMGFGIITLLKREKKNFLGLILTGIPIVIYGILYLLTVQNLKGSTYNDIEVINVLKDYIGTGHYLLLYIISLIIIATKGSKLAKKYFLFIPIIYVITIYNPMFTKIITKYFTGSEVFWRLFWLLPMEFSITYSCIILMELKDNKWYKSAILIIEIFLLIIMGKFVYTKQNGFEKAENLNKIPQIIIEQTRIHIG